jgi:hypothetical protein
MCRCLEILTLEVGTRVQTTVRGVNLVVRSQWLNLSAPSRALVRGRRSHLLVVDFAFSLVKCTLQAIKVFLLVSTFLWVRVSGFHHPYKINYHEEINNITFVENSLKHLYLLMVLHAC